LIAEYERWHQADDIFPEVIQSIRDASIENMEISRAGHRFFVIIAASDPLFGRRESEDGRSQFRRHRMGRVDEALSAGDPRCRTRRRVVSDGPDLPPHRASGARLGARLSLSTLDFPLCGEVLRGRSPSQKVIGCANLGIVQQRRLRKVPVGFEKYQVFSTARTTFRSLRFAGWARSGADGRDRTSI